MQAIRITIWLSLSAYLAAILTMLARGSDDRTARTWWTASCLAYVAHVAAAFHFFHGWSHAHAVEHTENTSGFGPGIFVSYAFTLIWLADVAGWWFWPAGHAHRPLWSKVLLHAFMAFMIFNGTVVFADGPSRWGGLALFAILALACLRRVRKTGTLS